MKVTIQVTTPDDLPNTVIVTDPLPGCLEAVDPHVGPGGPHDDARPSGTLRGPVYAPMQWFPSRPERWAFPAMEVHKDEVTFMARSLRAGSHTCTYEAVVVTSGSFQVPPAKAYLSSQPELMGLSGTHGISVADRD